MTVGCIYVIKSDNNIVKVGKAVDPFDRINEHCRASRRWGVDIVERWWSHEHEDYGVSERLLPEWAASRADRPAGNEYFYDLSFGRTVHKAIDTVRRVEDAGIYGTADRLLMEPVAREARRQNAGV